MPALTTPCNSQGFWKNDLSDLWYVSEITPSWNGEISSKSILISGLIYVIPELSELPGVGVLTGLSGGLYVGSG